MRTLTAVKEMSLVMPLGSKSCCFEVGFHVAQAGLSGTLILLLPPSAGVRSMCCHVWLLDESSC